MKSFYKYLTKTTALLAAAAIFAGCSTSVEDGATRGNAIPLTENTWADGGITQTREEQWFTFTATAGTHYLHVSFGTLTHLYIQVYDNGNNPVGDRTDFGGSGSGYTALTVTSGKAYYIKVIPYSGSGGGTYLIAFNTMPSPPLPPGTLTAAVMLAENAWTSGTITSSNNEQWFRFTATAATQYIHVNFGTLTDLYVQLYDHNGSAPGNRTRLQNNNYNRYTSVAVTSGQVCYIKVTPYSGSGGGTYLIAFNTSTTAPD
jgi:hypothetical protein